MSRTNLKIGQYTILHLLGKGGMAMVYLGVHQTLGKSLEQIKSSKYARLIGLAFNGILFMGFWKSYRAFGAVNKNNSK